MKPRGARKTSRKETPFLYFRTLEQMLAWQKVPVAQKFEWLAAQMEFYHFTRPGRAAGRLEEGR